MLDVDLYGVAVCHITPWKLLMYSKAVVKLIVQGSVIAFLQNLSKEKLWGLVSN